MARIKDEVLEELVDNEGELRTGPVSTIGVLRLALDLQDVRAKLAKLMMFKAATGASELRVNAERYLRAAQAAGSSHVMVPVSVFSTMIATLGNAAAEPGGSKKADT